MRLRNIFKRRLATTKVRGPLLRRYFGIQEHYIKGAVFAPEEPKRVFHVGLLDVSGEVLLVARADRANSGKDIPAGHGFEFPIPTSWLLEAGTERTVQFKVIETGVLFPREPRTLSLRKLLRTFKIGEETARSVQARMKDETLRLNKFLPQDVIVMVTHEMMRTGAPLILLEIIRQMKARHAARIVLLSLKAGGQLTNSFQEHCEAVIDGIETALNSAPEESAALLALLRTRSASPTALVNSLCSMKLAVALQRSGFEVCSLIHEYPFAFTPEHVKKLFSVTTELIFPCKDVEIAFRRLGQLPRTSTSRPTAKVTLLPQGCYMLEQEPPDPTEVEALRTRYREEFNIGREDRVVFSCGTMDSRKGFDWFGALMRSYARSSPHGAATHFIWAGRVADEDLFFHLKHELRESGVIGNFHHLDDLADTRAAFQLADVFVLCSRIDPFPSVVLEAWANGVPVIGFDRCQGCADIIKETEFGVVVPYLDENRTARAVDMVLADSQLRARVQEEGPTYVARHFSYKGYVDMLEAMLSKKSIHSKKDFGAEALSEFEEISTDAAAADVRLLGRVNGTSRNDKPQHDQIKLESLNEASPRREQDRTTRSLSKSMAAQSVQTTATDHSNDRGDATVVATRALPPSQALAARLNRAAGRTLPGS
ncbi:MAG: glycosyltransferase [Verrucomicrobia bacterium]|nr:glycosyltransferase [Verrucomicrobiota bacterium]